jgi:hypothetical protein
VIFDQCRTSGASGAATKEDDYLITRVRVQPSRSPPL